MSKVSLDDYLGLKSSSVRSLVPSGPAGLEEFFSFMVRKLSYGLFSKVKYITVSSSEIDQLK